MAVRSYGKACHSPDMPVPPLLLALLAGGGIGVQAFVNGRLATHLGSAALAGTVSNAVALAILTAIALRTGAAGALARLRAGARPRWWQLAACASGAFPVIIAAEAAPKIGVARLTVAMVCGLTTGSLLLDRTALSPGPPRPLTAARVAGAVLALSAVSIAAVGSEGALHLGLLALVVLAGACQALVQAALGHLTGTFGDPFVASGLSFALGGATSAAAWVLTTGALAPSGWDAPGAEWIIGGVAGAATTVVMAAVVRTLGVLRLTLAIVAGQSVAALVIDASRPAAEQPLSVRTVVSLLLVFLAVGVSGSSATFSRPARQ
jgi:transporter family-2 protein